MYLNRNMRSFVFVKVDYLLQNNAFNKISKQPDSQAYSYSSSYYFTLYFNTLFLNLLNPILYYAYYAIQYAAHGTKLIGVIMITKH